MIYLYIMLHYMLHKNYIYIYIFFFFFAICRLITVNLYFKMGIQRFYDNVLYILHFLYKLIVKSYLKAPVMQ